MSARYGSTVLFLLLLSPVLSAAQGLSFGVYGGAGNVKMSEYNNSVTSANAYNVSIGINSSLKKLELGVIPEITAVYDLNTSFGSLGIYFKNSLIILRDTTSSAHWENGMLAQSLRADFSTFYSALGLRYNIAADDNPSLTGYAGAGAGLCHYYWNTITDDAYKIDGGVSHKIKKDWATAVPALDMECGVNWWYSDNMGLGIKGGYRLAQGRVIVKVTDADKGAYQAEDSVDYSGFFANAGILLKFGTEGDTGKKEQSAGKGGQFPEIAEKLYSEAEGLYNDGLYMQAQQKLKEAENVAPGNAAIEELKGKIDIKMKEANNSDNIKRILKEADEFRQKNDIKKARARYVEVLSMNAADAHASHFLEDFDKKSVELFESAKAFRKDGRLKESLEKAKQAADYHDNDAIDLFINDLLQQMDVKAKTNSLFNDGVDSFRKGDYKKAYDLWSEVVGLDPGDKEAAANMEKAKKKMEEADGGAKAAQKKAMEEAKALYAIGKMDEAMQKCQYVLRLDPDNEECKKMVEDIKKAQSTDNQDLLKKR
jgi:tetratricopeptide (TPR) repeat protein